MIQFLETDNTVLIQIDQNNYWYLLIPSDTNSPFYCSTFQSPVINESIGNSYFKYSEQLKSLIVSMFW